MKNNAISRILKEDREYGKNELAQMKLDSFQEIDKAMKKLDYDDASELMETAQQIIAVREDSVFARYVLGSIAFVRRPHEDNIFMQNLLITFYDNHNWTLVEFLCGMILGYNENRYALRILADCLVETGREDEQWPVLERLVKVDFDERRIPRQLGDHFLETGEKDKAILYYRRAMTRCISAKDVESIRALWSVLLDVQKEDYGYFLGVAEKVSTSVDKGLSLTLLTDLYPHYAGDMTRAVLILKKALEIDPSSREARDELIKVYRKKYEKSARLDECIRKSGLNSANRDRWIGIISR